MNKIIGARRDTAERGTTLLELMIAVAIFLLISTSAFMMLNQQQNASTGLNGQVGLNMALRNTLSMLQMDLANAGSNYYQDTNISTSALGVTMVNHVVASTSGSGCYTAATGGAPLGNYGTNCFDQLNIIQVDSTYPVVNATDSTGANGTGNCSDTNTGVAYGQAGVLNPASLTPTTETLAQTAAFYKVGDQLLLIRNNGTLFTSVVLTAVPTVSGSAVKFTFNATTTTTNSVGTFKGINATDPLNIAACSGTTPCPPNSVPAANVRLTNSFCGGGGVGVVAGDWILKLAPITYQVNSSAKDYAGNQNPTLTRTANGVTSTVMEQVIGFKVGGSIWNDPNSLGVDITNYNYDSSSYTLNPGVASANAYDFTLLRSIRISMIGRTVPVYTKNYVYRNTFDSGPYQVQGAAVVVNPRNMNGIMQ